MMRMLIGFAVSLLVFSGSLGFSRPAAAIDQAQWYNICFNTLGLRSAATPTDTNGAGYGMDNGNLVPMDCFKAEPADWNTLLAETLARIKAFEGSGARFLLIVSTCPGLARDYPGTFPKCNKVAGGVVAATPNTLDNYTVQQLFDWVNSNIP